MQFILLLSVFVIATCGLVYELISSTLASYLLGDSVTQFSTVIGVYLFSMGIGSFLSRYIHRNLTAVFVEVELLVGLVGGCSAFVLFALFEHVASFRVLLYSTIVIIGTLVGLEIPLLMRILKQHFEFKDLVSRIFTLDYIGALAASLLFPLVLVPRLGLVQSCFLFGILNVAVALSTLYLFRQEMPWIRFLKGTAIVLLLALTLGFVYAEKLAGFAETTIYPDQILFAKSSPYQRIVLTKSNHDMRLYLNGNLQFSSRDEYRYHEALVHVGLAGLKAPKKVLVLGGGDGLAVREILKYPSVESIVLVDLDPEVTDLFATQEVLRRLNENALVSPKVRIIHQDAFVWLKSEQGYYDFIVADFPDPSNYSLGKLYSTAFFRKIRDVLDPKGCFVIQCTSPYVARKAFWCVDRTLQVSGFFTMPYHVYVPSFGEWGFILASIKPFPLPEHLPAGLRFLSVEALRSMLQFPSDMAPLPTEANRLTNQALVHYFEEEWAEYTH